MSDLTPWVSKSHGSPISEYLASPVQCWPALLPLIGMLWCCAPGDVASPSTQWLMALGTPQVAQCMCLLIEESTIRMLIFMNYFWLGPRPSLGCFKLRAGPQDNLERWGWMENTKVLCFSPNTKQRENSNYCFWNMQIMTYFSMSYFQFSSWTEKWILVLGCVQDLAILVQWSHTHSETDLVFSSLEKEGDLCTVQNSVLSTWPGWYWWMQSALKFHIFF